MRAYRTFVATVTSLALVVQAPLSALAGIGIGIPGVVDARQGVLAHAVNLGVGSDGLPLAARLSERTALPVAVENDVNAAALGASRIQTENDLENARRLPAK